MVSGVRPSTHATIGATPTTIGAIGGSLAPPGAPGAAWRRLWRFPLTPAETATNGPGSSSAIASTSCVKKYRG
eukprot:COSAG02_NODE_7714_length_2878_cov_3.147175_3_plen_73_part_00